jgi:hypothetical protein
MKLPEVIPLTKIPRFSNAPLRIASGYYTIKLQCSKFQQGGWKLATKRCVKTLELLR